MYVSPLAQLLSQQGLHPPNSVSDASHTVPQQTHPYKIQTTVHGVPQPSATYPYGAGPMNPIIAKNLTSTLGGFVESVTILPVTEDVKQADYVPTAVPVPVPHDKGDGKVYGYNAPPLNAILPDYIVERFPLSRHAHDPTGDNDSSHKELSRKFNSPNDCK